MIAAAARAAALQWWMLGRLHTRILSLAHTDIAIDAGRQQGCSAGMTHLQPWSSTDIDCRSDASYSSRRLRVDDRLIGIHQ